MQLSALSLAITRLGRVPAYSPLALFTGSTNGAWYDPSDTTTLFQDAAGTLPVTAVEQPVGLMKDKSGRNNHAFNSSGNSANFPVLSARYNLLTKTEQFDDAVWVAFGSASKTGTNVAIAPDGTTTADSIRVIAANDQVYQFSNLVSGASYTFTCYVKRNSGSNQSFRLKGQTAGVTDNYSANFAATDVWQQFTHTFTTTVAVSSATISIAGNSGGTQANLLVWGADLRVANDALNQPAYQRVNTATDYDTVGFKPYLRFNGANQWLQTNSIDFTYGDKMFVSAGVRKLSDAATGVVVELSASQASNTGSFNLRGPTNASQLDYDFLSKGTSVGVAVGTSLAAPITNVLTGIGNISGDLATLRINGVQVTQSTADQGTGNYGNYPLYIGARAGTSLWFNGRLYQMVIAGKQASAAEITSTETYLNQKTGAF